MSAFWGKADITLTGSNVCFEPKRLRSASDAASGDAAIGPTAIQVPLPRHSPATAADACKEPQQRGGSTCRKTGCDGHHIFFDFATPIAKCVNRFTYGMRTQT